MRSMQVFVASVAIVGAVTLGLMAPGRLLVLLGLLVAALGAVLLTIGEPAIAQWIDWWFGAREERDE